MDHLGIDRFMALGFCIGGPFTSTRSSGSRIGEWTASWYRSPSRIQSRLVDPAMSVEYRTFPEPDAADLLLHSESNKRIDGGSPPRGNITGPGCNRDEK